MNHLILIIFLIGPATKTTQKAHKKTDPYN